MIDPGEHLRGLAHSVKDAYVAHTDARAILLVGSAASGDADYYSDVDVVLYHEQLPSDEAFAAARRELAAERFTLSFQSEFGYGERYHVGGVECQLGHVTIRHAEHTFARVVSTSHSSGPDTRRRLEAGSRRGLSTGRTSGHGVAERRAR